MRKIACLVALASLCGARVAHAQTLSAAAAAAFDMSTFAKGLSQPTDVVNLADGRTVITTRLGDVIIYVGGVKSTAGNIAVNPSDGEQGLLGVVADPNFATNHYLYFYADIGGTNDKHHILRYVLGANNTIGTQTVILGTGGVTPGILGPANHNGGSMNIYNNQLYIGVGDTGANATPPTNKFGSCLNQANGKILRINLDGSIPTDNPLSNVASVTSCTSTGSAFGTAAPDKRIWAWGLRNPFRFWIDPSGAQAGTMWIGDVGEVTREEISVGHGDQHYGYPFQEGTTDWGPALLANECMGMTPARACTPPVYDYPHSNGNNCVIGGLIPNGTGWIDPWKSRYIFGDHGSGNVWTLDVNANRTGVVAASLKSFASAMYVAAFRMGADNALYIDDVDAGSVYRITPKGQVTQDAGPPPADAGKDASGGAGGAGGNGGNGGGGRGGNGGTSNAGGNGGSSVTGTGGQGGALGNGGAGNVGGVGTGGGAVGAGGSSSGTGIPGETGGSVGSGATGSGGAGLTPDGQPAASDTGGCTCGSAGRRASDAGAVALVGLALVAAGRARRKRARRTGESKSEGTGS
jgi:glucose/arabinose dehydrogenase